MAQKQKKSKGGEKSKGDEQLEGGDDTEPVQDPATVALALSTCLAARRRNNALMNMTSG